MLFQKNVFLESEVNPQIVLVDEIDYFFDYIFGF
jgi:hypothetical protein